MQSNILSDILHYIDFLRGCGYNVTLSGFESNFEPYTAQLLPYEVHLHKVCYFLKSNPATAGMCVANKALLMRTQFEKPQYGSCYAGVEEYRIPVFWENMRLICINVSGYRGKLEDSEENRQQLCKLCGKEFETACQELSENVPEVEEIMACIKPLEYMILALYKECRQIQMNHVELPSRAVYLKAMAYIYEHYMHDISCDKIAQQLGFSSSYLRAVFQKEGDIPISRMITQVRLARARELLQNTNLRISEIAMQCGFGDSNYFSAVFHRTLGLSPRQYRLSVDKKGGEVK